MEEQPEKKRSLEEIFNVDPKEEPSKDLVPYEQGEVIEGAVEDVVDEVDRDFEEAREKLKKITDITDTALEDLAHIAKDSEQPRSYDALSKLVAAAVQANKAVVEIHKNRKEGKGEESSGPRTVNNNLYMTTADWQRLEAQERGEEDGEAEEE